MKCPLRKIMMARKLEEGKWGQTHGEGFEDCYGEECMAYNSWFDHYAKKTRFRCGLVKGGLDV